MAASYDSETVNARLLKNYLRDIKPDVKVISVVPETFDEKHVIEYIVVLKRDPA